MNTLGSTTVSASNRKGAMCVEGAIDSRDERESCVVCDEALRPGEALARMHYEGRELPICCLRCLEAYQEDPKPYLERSERRSLLQAMHKLLRNWPKTW